MRLLMINLLATALVLFSASLAGAFELRMVPQQGGDVAPGSQVAFDIYLDTQSQNGISTLVVGLAYDESVMTWNQGASFQEDYYPLYAPAVVGAKAEPSFPATWLVLPDTGSPSQWAGNPMAGPYTAQVNVEYIANSGGPLGATQGTSTDLLVATLVFDVAVAGGYTDLGFLAGDGGNGMSGGTILTINGDGTSVIPTTPILGDAFVNAVIPEPTTGLLVGLGLVGLGVAGRRRA